jgi:FdhE protein
MSIRIVPVEQLAERQAASLDITPLLLPQPATLYRQRAERLQQLAAGHVMADYLQLASRIAQAQHQLVHSQPVLLPAREDYFRQCAEHGLPPLGPWPGNATGSGSRCCRPCASNCAMPARHCSRCWHSWRQPPAQLKRGAGTVVR